MNNKKLKQLKFMDVNFHKEGILKWEFLLKMIWRKC